MRFLTFWLIVDAIQGTLQFCALLKNASNPVVFNVPKLCEAEGCMPMHLWALPWMQPLLDVNV